MGRVGVCRMDRGTSTNCCYGRAERRNQEADKTDSGVGRKENNHSLFFLFSSKTGKMI